MFIISNNLILSKQFDLRLELSVFLYLYNIMGCIQTETVSADPIKTQLRKLKYSIDLKKQRIYQQRLKADQLLYGEFSKPLGQRSKKLERAMIIGNTRLLNQKNIYCTIENETNVILQHANFLDSQKQLEKIKAPLNILRYCSSFMDSEYLYKFQVEFKQVYPTYPFPTEQQIANEMIKLQKRQEVSFKQEIEYLFQFSTNYNIPMDKINEIGHNYKYGAQKYLD